MHYSENYHLNEPDLADQYNLSHWNENMDILDSVIQNEVNSRTTEMGNEISARQTADTALQNITNETFKMALFNLIYPIGVTYPQYPECPSPNDLWGDVSEWTLLNYNGAFFRASGGMASAFNSGLQNESIKAHQHGMQHYHDRGTMEITGKDALAWGGEHSGVITNGNRCEGAFSLNNGNDKYQSNNQWHGTTQSSGFSANVPVGISFKASNGWTGRTSGSLIDQGNGGDKINTDSNSQARAETAPANYTYQIWKRTA